MSGRELRNSRNLIRLWLRVIESLCVVAEWVSWVIGMLLSTMLLPRAGRSSTRRVIRGQCSSTNGTCSGCSKSNSSGWSTSIHCAHSWVELSNRADVKSGRKRVLGSSNWCGSLCHYLRCWVCRSRVSWERIWARRLAHGSFLIIEALMGILLLFLAAIEHENTSE